MLTLNVGDNVERNDILEKLVEMLYERNNLDLKRGSFRVRGDILEVVPINQHNHAIRIEFFGDEIDKILEVDILTNKVINNKKNSSIKRKLTKGRSALFLRSNEQILGKSCEDGQNVIE